jgi:hypothetical protein
MPACLKCQSEHVVTGTINSTEGEVRTVFRPKSLRFFAFVLQPGTLLARETHACLDCGLVWTSTPPEALREFLKKHCDELEK